MTDAPGSKSRGRGLIVLGAERLDRLISLVAADKLDLMIVYIILLAGTDVGQVNTTWSVNSINRYTGMSKRRAQRLIGELMKAGLVAAAPASQAEPAASKRNQVRHLLTAFTETREPVFLPMALVTGLAHETPILQRLRRRQDPLVLQVLLDLYTQLTFDQTIAVDPAGYRVELSHSEKALAELGPTTIWSMRQHVPTWSEKRRGMGRRLYLPLDRHLWGVAVGPRSSAVSELLDLGICFEETWVCCGTEEEPEPVFPLVDDLEELARKASVACLSRTRVQAPARGLLIPLPTYRGQPRILGLLRLTVEPHLKGRAAAFARRGDTLRRMRDALKSLSVGARMGSFDDPMNV